MTHDQTIQHYIASVETKLIDGKPWYRLVTSPKRLCPLGYFPSEEEAKKALLDYLIANRKA